MVLRETVHTRATYEAMPVLLFSLCGVVGCQEKRVVHSTIIRRRHYESSYAPRPKTLRGFGVSSEAKGSVCSNKMFKMCCGERRFLHGFLEPPPGISC